MSVRPPQSSSWDEERQSSLCDEAVRDRLVAGDEAALGELYDEYAAFVFGLAARVTADRRAAEDVTQEVFVRVWERPDGFDPHRGSMRSWLGMLAHRRAVDYVRREEASRRRSQREASMLSAAPDIEEQATASAVAARVRRAVACLPVEQRLAVDLAYFGGKTYRQVAEELGIPEGTAKSRLRIGLQRMASMLEKEGLGPWR